MGLRTDLPLEAGFCVLMGELQGWEDVASEEPDEVGSETAKDPEDPETANDPLSLIPKVSNSPSVLGKNVSPVMSSSR